MLARLVFIIRIYSGDDFVVLKNGKTNLFPYYIMPKVKFPSIRAYKWTINK